MTVVVLVSLYSGTAMATNLMKSYYTNHPHCITWAVYNPNIDVVAGTGATTIISRLGDAESMSGQYLKTVEATVGYSGYDGTVNFDLVNWTTSTRMLSTPGTIDANEKSSTTAATPLVIRQTSKKVAGGDSIGPIITGTNTIVKSKGFTLKACFSPE